MNYNGYFNKYDINSNYTNSNYTNSNYTNSNYTNSNYTNSQVNKNWSITPRSIDVKTFKYKYEINAQISYQNNENIVNNIKQAAITELKKIIVDDMVVIKRQDHQHLNDVYEVQYNLINQQSNTDTAVIDMYEYEINGKKFTHEQISEGMKRAFPEHWL